MPDQKLRLEEFLPYRLSYTSNLVSDVVAGAYQALFGLSIPEWRVVAHTAEHRGITQQDICARTRMDKVIISRAAIALTRRGLLVRTPNPDDGRSQLLLLSEAGYELYSAIVPKALELERLLFTSIPEQDIAVFTRVLRAVDRIALSRT